MATFKPKVFSHHLKDDGTFNVKICVYHNGLRAYPDTPYFVTKKQLTTKFLIKDAFLNERLADMIKGFRSKLVDLGDKLAIYSAKELGEYLLPSTKAIESNLIDFVKFSNDYVAELESKCLGKTKKNHYSNSFKTTINALVDFRQPNRILINSITSKMLEDFERYLKTERKGKRRNKSGELVEQTFKPVGQTAILNYMTNIRTLFNAARNKYNDLDKGEIRISHYPFNKYKIVKPEPTKSRSLETEIVKQLRDYPDTEYNGGHGTNRLNFGRDMFMLSFYLIGMNAIDLFYIDEYKKDRLTYKRSKTSGRRQDNALISVKVEPEAAAIIERYRDTTTVRVFNFYQMYSSSDGFTKAANKGLKRISGLMDLSATITLYYARHSWATIARNDCNVSKDDVGEALNHSNPQHTVTDIYIKKSWKTNDNANRLVLNQLLIDNSEPGKVVQMLAV